MPAIYLFNRRTFLGGDDLQPAVFLSLLLRLVQLTLFLGPILQHLVAESRHSAGGLFTYVLFDSNPHDDSCRHSHMFGLLLLSYAVGSACYAIGCVLLEGRISHWAGIGSPTETQPRSTKVSYLLELKLMPFSIVLFLVFCTGLAMVASAPHYYRCNQNKENEDEDDNSREPPPWRLRDHLTLWWITAALLLITQLVEILVSWLYLLHLCAQPPRRANYFLSTGQQEGDNDEEARPTVFAMEDDDYAASRHELVEEMWAQRCAVACQCMGIASCFMFGGREVVGQQGDFGDVARALADYLETRGVLDVVPSDIAAGFLVLQRLQKLRVHRTRRQIVRRLTQTSNGETGILIPSQSEEELISLDASTLAHPPKNGPIIGTSGLESLSPFESVAGRGETTPMVRASTSSSDDMDGLVLLFGGNSSQDSEGSRRHSSFRYTMDETEEANGRELTNILNPENVVDRTALEEGARYAKYALAIYTWVLYLYVHPVTGVPRLAANGCLGCCGSKQQSTSSFQETADPRFSSYGTMGPNGRYEGDNLCESHKTALLLTVGLKENDLVYLQLKSGFRDNPYCILLDHEWKCVVVSIRGTFSLEDCVTDVLIEPESLSEMGQEYGFDAENQYCHGGVLLWVRNIYRDLQQHQILERLLLGDNAQYPDYTLRLVGHSLGAAACTVLSYMLRSRFPSVRCVNFSPPGCSLTWNLAIGCKDWCSSFVLDSDIVPRLSFDSMSAWRDEILDVIGRIKVPKAEVVRRFLRHSSNSSSCEMCFDPPLDDPDGSLHDINDILYEPHEVPDSEYQRQLTRFKYIHEARRRSRGDLREIKLFPPGKMVHLVKTGEKRECVHGLVKCLTCFTTNYGFDYTPVWINNDDLNEIVVNPQMGTDHFPNRMLNVVTSVATKYGLRS